LHVLIGVGFLLVKQWGLFVYLLYAGFGIINAGVNLAVLHGPHRIRIVFMLSLAAFTAYILWRRKRFAA
jgi:membrane protein implicated in regulation of membrane protease activity